MASGDVTADRPATRRFDREFFENHLVAMLDEWRDAGKLDPDSLAIEVETTRGKRIIVSAMRAATTWVELFTEDDELRFLPMDEIAQVIVRLRSEPAPKRAVGFSVERVAEGDVVRPG